MNKVSLVVVYNNSEQLQELQRSITVPSDVIIEEVFLDNRENKYPSAASVYNYALQKKVSGDIIVFSHQDIRFHEDSIKKIAEMCESEQETLFGVAGIENLGKKNWGGIISTLDGAVMNWPDPKENGLDRFGNKSGYARSVFVLDECLIAGHRNVFEGLSFDESVCSGWHLYAADLCIQCHQRGMPVKVMDAGVKHLSSGHVDRAFIACEGRLARKYKKQYAILSHTNGWTYTDPVKRKVQLLYRFFRYRWWRSV